MGRERDPFWAYAEKVSNCLKFKCIYCKREFAGGASRIKAHLAGVSGHDIVACNAVPLDVQNQAQATQKKKKAQATQGTNKKLKSASTLASKLKTKGKEEYMAEIVLNDVVDRLIATTFSLATENIGFESSFKLELKNLLETLFKIKFLLDDAQKRQSSEDSVRIWLMELRDVAYDADNVLDEFSYESFWQKVQTQNLMVDQVRSFSFCNLDKVKTINQLLDKIVHDVTGFDLRMDLVNSISKISFDVNIDPFLDDSEVVGREYDVTKTVNVLISSGNQQVISVLPIVGMAGLGKTTLAKLVYNNELIKKHFDVLAWVNVGKHFDVEGILREILKSLEEDLSGIEYDEILQICAKKLREIKYLLILDDVQDEDLEKWNTLKGYLSKFNSSTGNNIVVTTRSDNVAEIMETHPKHQLEKLSKDDCWSIFKKRTFTNGRIPLTLDLEVIGREIAKRCGAVPWAARVLGGTMCFKFDKNKWLEIQNNKIWDLLDEDNSDIFPVLKLCFDHLPTPSLKRCLAYCAIFPKDYDLKKDEIIQHWMAEGFLESSKEDNMVLEDIGNMYFNILLVTSFFQNARKDAYGNIISCKMHGLVHDFALSISKSETLILEGDLMNNVSSIQPLFVRFDGKTTLRTSFSGDGFIKLRTLISKSFNLVMMLSNFKYLRVLKLSVHVLPNSIGQLIHLRLLHISQTRMRELPKSITKLYNLQTLRIGSTGQYGISLPKDLSNLIKLRHIHINYFQYRETQTPKNMGWLTCLQTLPIFVVGLDEGYLIKELGPLKNLRGEIDIRNLENVKDEEEAKSAKLKEKEIFKLGLHWNFSMPVDRYDKDENVLEGLQPHPNLKILRIESYLGKKFPSWVGLSLYHNLIQINLRECTLCEEVPTLGHLPCLRDLELYGMHGVSKIGSEFYSYSDGSYRNTTALFPVLRILKLQHMSILKEWNYAKELTSAGEVLVFPCLEELIIWRCDELRDLPDSLHTWLSLQKMVVVSCPYLSSWSVVPSSIRHLEIKSGIDESLSELLHTCVSLQKFVVAYFPRLRSLPGVPSVIQHLEIIECGIEELSSGLQLCTSLQYLKISNCWNLKSIPESLHTCVSLQKFIVEGCPKLRSLPGVPSVIRHLEIIDCGIEELSSGLQSLQYLEIRTCLNLKSISKSLHTCVSLQKFIVKGCPKLRSLPGVPSVIRHLEIIDCGIEELSSGLQSLQYLEIRMCSNLKSIPKSLHTCVSLQKFVVYNCLKLRYLPGVPSGIQHLEIIWCGINELPSGLQSCASLQYLEIRGCRNLKSIPDLEVFHSLINLKISNCPDLRLELRQEGRLKTLVIGGFIDELDAFLILRYPSIRYTHASLKRLTLLGRPSFNSLPNEIQFFTALEELQIQNFNGMEALPDWLSNISSLQKLSLCYCRKLVYLPIHDCRNLKLLRIECCRNLEERCAERSGAKWFQIAHVPNIRVNGKYIQGKYSKGCHDFYSDYEEFDVIDDNPEDDNISEDEVEDSEDDSYYNLQEDSILENNQLDDNWCQGTSGLENNPLDDY